MENSRSYCSYLGIFPNHWDTTLNSTNSSGYSYNCGPCTSQLTFQQQPADFYPVPITNQQRLENFRSSMGPRPTEHYNVFLPPQVPPQHITLYSLQKRQNRITNPVLRARLIQQQQHYDAYRYTHGHYPGYWIHPNDQRMLAQNFVGQYPPKTSLDVAFQKQARDNARRKQVENSIVYQKRKILRKKTNAIHRKKLKRLQREPIKRFRYNLWHDVKGERDELKRGRKIIRNRRKANISSPEECSLWNCPKKLRRKGRLNRRYPKSPESISSLDRRSRSRSRTPIMRLRDTPIME